MPEAPKPANEVFRLRSLHELEILDTPDDPNFDVVRNLAANILQTPIAAISFIDSERLWLKSIRGVQLKQTARNDAICSHTILEPDRVLHVPDTSSDLRFADNPYVAGPLGVRSYAGAPVLSPGGYPVGTLCVVDHKPRAFSASELQQLQQLARCVGTSLHLHRTLDRLQTSTVTDGLTGALNRFGFKQAMRRRRNEMVLTPPESDVSSGLVGIEIRGVHIVNNTYGEAAGDAVLVGVVQRLNTLLRPGDLVARLGGDDFVFYINDVGETSGLAKLTATIQDLFGFPFVVNGQRIRVQVSISVSAFRSDESQYASAMTLAEDALHSAKSKMRYSHMH